MAGIVITPHIAHSSEEDSQWLYDAFSMTCHQKLSRSLCLFSGDGYFIADCTEQAGEKVGQDNDIIRAEVNGKVGYKLAVCARDVGLYLFLLIGALAYPFFRKLNSDEVPAPIWLVLAIVPFALDGTIQLFSSIAPGLVGFYESSNMIRLSTGALAGFVASFYVLPVLNSMFSQMKKPQKKETKKG
ncbi:MAG: DUF2085 domain-containing protein [Candidatus Micrarchaeota archaeon]